MVTGYLNTTKNSPITGAIICDTEILLYGKDGRKLSMNDASRVKNLFKYIDRTSKTKAGFVELENAKQAMYNESFTKKLFGFTKKLFGYVDNTSKNTAEPVKIEDALQDWSIKRTKWLEEKANAQYLYMKEIIEAKAQKAREANKKLLVVIGEEHTLPDPHFFELLALDICNANGIKAVLLENASIENFMPKKIHTIYHYSEEQLLHNVLSNSQVQENTSLHPIDPLNEGYKLRTVSPQARDKLINQSIKEVDQDALCVVGGAHIAHIKTDPELSAKYEFAIFHSANLAHLEKYQDKSSEELDNLLKEKESKILAIEQKIQNLIKQSNSQVDLKTEFEIYEKHTVNKMYIMKSHSPKEIINLSLEDGTAKAIPSDTEALDMAKNVITQNNPQSKILTGLKSLINDYLQLQKIENCDQTPPKLDADYLSGKISEAKYNNKSSAEMKMDQMTQMILRFKPQNADNNNDSESESEDELRNESASEDLDSQQSVIHPDADLTGNWDTWPDC